MEVVKKEYLRVMNTVQKERGEGEDRVGCKLDGRGKEMLHVMKKEHDLNLPGIDWKRMISKEATIDTTSAVGKLVFGIFAARVELKRGLFVDRTTAGFSSATVRGRHGGCSY